MCQGDKLSIKLRARKRPLERGRNGEKMFAFNVLLVEKCIFMVVAKIATDGQSELI